MNKLKDSKSEDNKRKTFQKARVRADEDVDHSKDGQVTACKHSRPWDKTDSTGSLKQLIGNTVVKINTHAT